MLANKYKDKKDKIDWDAGVFMQPKYNGMRMLYDGKKAWSRGGKLMIPDVIKHLQIDTKGHILDGELILPDMPVLQETMKAAKKYREGVSDKLIYVVYDIIDADMPFEDRQEVYTNVVNSGNNLSVIAAPTGSFSTRNDGEARISYEA